MEPTPSVVAERVFLHDLCNAMAIVQGMLHILDTKAKRKPMEISQDEILLKLEKAISSLDKMNDLINARRAQLRVSE